MSNETHDAVEAEPHETTDYGHNGHTTDPVRLVGYPPRKESGPVRRLHEKPSSKTYVEIKVADIVDPPSAATKRRLEPGQIAIWVRCNAHILLNEYDVENTHHHRWPRR